jgi:hypothetical protein
LASPASSARRGPSPLIERGQPSPSTLLTVALRPGGSPATTNCLPSFGPCSLRPSPSPPCISCLSRDPRATEGLPSPLS